MLLLHSSFTANMSAKRSVEAALEFLWSRDLQSSMRYTTVFRRIALTVILNYLNEAVHARTFDISVYHVFIETF